MEKVINRTCDVCGGAFTVIPSRLKHGRGKHCSPACQYFARRAAPKKSVTLECVGCGVGFSRQPSHANDAARGLGKYCSRPCRDRYRVGALVPNWFGAPREYRGTNWQKQKRAARARDGGVCRSCGDKGTDVHHKVPFRLFGEDWISANDLENLITLCRTCHRIADAAIQAAEIATRGFSNVI